MAASFGSEIGVTARLLFAGVTLAKRALKLV